MKKKKLKYKPIRKGETLNISVAISQASALLDQAAAKGIREDNVDILLSVADRWIAIAEMFTEGSEDDDEHVDISDAEVPYGFGPPNKEIDDEEEVNDEDE